MKSWFGRVVHDLKGPLAPMQTAVYLLRAENVPAARQKELLDVLDRQTRRLNAMLGELGEWGRAENATTVSARTSTPVPVLVDLAVGGLPACHIEPVYKDGTDTLEIDGEQSSLVGLFGALIGYACSRDPAHHPELTLSREDGLLVASVTDHGAPLDATHRDTLFDEPQRHAGDDSLGLRLVIAAAIARRHGGRLIVEDGDGLRLRCELPL